MLFRVAVSWVVLAASAAAQFPFSTSDLVAVKTIGEVQPSPDGRTVLFTIGPEMMRVSSRGGQPGPVPGVPKGASTVRWSPVLSRIAFIRENAVWTFDLESNHLTRVCDYYRSNAFLSKAGNMLAWSPDGAWLAFAGSLEPPLPAQDPVVITRLQYKGRTALADNRRAHLYIVPSAGGTPRALTTGETDEHSIDWTPDGRELIYLSNPESDPDARLNYDLFAVDVKSAKSRRITRTPGVEMDPRVSPDGRWIAYTATKREITTIDSVAEDAHAWIVPVAGGEGRELNAALDRRTADVEWAPDSKRIVYTAGDHGSALICATLVDGGKTSCDIGHGGQAGSLGVARDGSLYFTLSTPKSSAELFRLEPGSGEPRRLTNLNGAFLSQRLLTTPETISFRSFDGAEVQGWLYPALEARGPSPLILSIHGGPHGSHGYGFNPAFQVYASRGYAVLAINPRGSSGYGQKFSDGCVNNWGGGDYKDLMAGLDHVLATHGNIDRNRLFVTGSSYGGYMTNWVITQTNRFKAAVASASVSNLISFYATSLYQDLVHAEFNGFPWAGENYATLWKWSPMAHVARVSTPTLFLHGENDNDVHITQAEEMYTALRRRGVEAQLVRYPREGHGFNEPRHRMDAVERTLAWFDRFSR
jgi:dipeptidyl aminopeptidase/acylaminoacyl peptidase